MNKPTVVNTPPPPTSSTRRVGQARTFVVSRVLVAPLLWLGLALLLLGLHQWWLNSRANLGGWGVDDAWITFRYSHNLALGNGPVWNVGERVEGYTNFLWMLLVAGAIKLGFGGIGVSILAGAAAALVTVPLTYRLAETGRWRGRLPVVSAALTLLLAADGSFATWSIAGLETSFYTMLLIAGVLLFVLSIEAEGNLSDTITAGGWGPMLAGGAGLLLVLAAITRPEGLYAYALGGLFRLYTLVQRRKLLRADLYYLLPLIILYLPYFVWRWSYYGWPLPNTFYNKVGSGWVQVERGIRYHSKFVDRHSELFFFLPFVALLTQRLNRRLLFIFSLVVGYWLYIVYVGGDWNWAIGRFFHPILPLLVVLNADAVRGLYDAIVARAGQQAEEQRGLKLKLALFGCLALLVIGYFQFERSSLKGEVNGDQLAYFQSVSAALYSNALWIDAHSSPSDLIATTAAGVLPYYSNRRYLDVLGLTNEHIAHVSIQQQGIGRPGHEKTDIPYVLLQQPRYIVLTAQDSEWLTNNDFKAAYQRVQWSSDKGYNEAARVYQRR